MATSNLLMDNPEVRAFLLAKSNVRTYLIQKRGINDMKDRVVKLHVQVYDEVTSVVRTLYGGQDHRRCWAMTARHLSAYSQ